MKLRFMPWVLLAVLAVTPAALAQKVNIEYDKDFTQKIETFAWYDSTDTSLAKTDPFLHSRIVNAIKHYLTTRGFREVSTDENPDVLVTYHTSTKEEVQFNTTNFGYGYPGGWYSPYGWGGGMSSSTTTATTYQRGTLVLDVWYAETKKLIWRGTVSGIVPEKSAKRERFVDKSLEKMIKKWEKIRKKAAAS